MDPAEVLLCCFSSPYSSKITPEL
uniref:Uncharacterized protein n=1 Tax=Anguilla anguilla TaxID=7936 RepID=A0A0E9VW54_ANGAN